MAYILGVDIGGTKTTVAIADGNCTPIKKVSFPTESWFGAESLVERINTCFESICKSADIKRQAVSFAGVASPGPLDIKQGKIIHIATMGFRNVPIKAMLEKTLSMPVFLQNDANCAALAESAIGVAKGADPLVYVTISTGVGAGIIVDGKILSGALSSAGEIGHLTIEPNGRQCLCGKKGCLELYSSGTAIATDATALRGEPTDTKTAFDLARQGDKEMQNIIKNAADKLGLALSSVYHLIDPQAVVLGGSVTKDYADFEATFNKALQKYTQPMENRSFDIRISGFDGEQVLLGALLYAVQCVGGEVNG